MLVALLSDIHDHTTRLLLALHAARKHGCSHLLFMGDMAGTSTFRTLREEWSYDMHLVFGNNEYDTHTFLRMAEQWPDTTMHGMQADISLGNRRIFFTHLPWHALKAAETGLYDAVFYGHTHCPESRQIGATLLANPGEVCGRRGAPTIGVYDTDSNTIRIIAI